jgi:peptidoglycan/xylan/chitin deacetylase (PgdA/CDA1 family)
MKILIQVIILLVFVSCTTDYENTKSGICISFDDRSINEWFELRDLFNDYNAKVTFFITQFDSLSDVEISKLRILEKDGHEIAFHGTIHVVSEYYIKERSYRAYFNNEINHGLEAMNLAGFSCSSFAYPYGSKYWFTDHLLLRNFNILRSVSVINKENDITKIDDIFFSFNGDKTVSALGIDSNSGLTFELFNKALKRVVKNNEVLLLSGHAPSHKKKAEGFTFDVEFLKRILNHSVQEGLKFYTIRELTTEYNLR